MQPQLFCMQSYVFGSIMSCSTSFIAVLVAALLITTLSYCSAESVYCVTPSANLCSSCPHNSTHCATLSEYAREAELYFTSNTTMVFLPGDHILDTNITVASITRLMMRGESSSGTIAIVVCKGQVGWDFTSMVDFKIHSLSFTSCNRKHGLVSATLLLQSTQNAELVNCSFHDNLGTALAVDNTKVTLSGKSEFIHNHCERCIAGGIVAFNSSNLTFTGNTTFLENQGGAQFINHPMAMVVESMHFKIRHLLSVEPPTSSTIQLVMAVQFMH